MLFISEDQVFVFYSQYIECVEVHFCGHHKYTADRVVVKHLSILLG